MINFTNITAYASQAGQITVENCKEWCLKQHYNTNYSGFIILIIFNMIMAGVFMILYKYSDKVCHNAKISEENLSIILNSVIKCMFLANLLYGVYWLLLR